ncbi:ArsR/SmtB family transcription factor [Haloarchaeobius salinus]|uniref:ArsR/SmtB family transcription factor n=1 Tax=Haloarchaeobius salinus TaxID=1198298 RepID=UPI00210D11CE|nr:helix-turn-helix domain-containing protein [Haloarchaeobius salinus]
MDDERAADALDVLGHEHRIAILRALAEADGPLSFSALHARVGMRDSGKFNYHLSRLCEYYVRETDEGYELGHAGERIISAADPGAAGADGGTATTDGGMPGSAGVERCPVCGDCDCEKLFHVHLTPPWA